MESKIFNYENELLDKWLTTLCRVFELDWLLSLEHPMLHSATPAGRGLRVEASLDCRQRRR